MTNLEKMNLIIGSVADKDQIKQWAYMNRILVDCLHLEKEFEVMTKSTNSFMDSDFYINNDNEFELWDKFLDSEYIE